MESSPNKESPDKKVNLREPVVTPRRPVSDSMVLLKEKSPLNAGHRKSQEEKSTLKHLLTGDIADLEYLSIKNETELETKDSLPTKHISEECASEKSLVQVKTASVFPPSIAIVDCSSLESLSVDEINGFPPTKEISEDCVLKQLLVQDTNSEVSSNVAIAGCNSSESPTNNAKVNHPTEEISENCVSKQPLVQKETSTAVSSNIRTAVCSSPESPTGEAIFFRQRLVYSQEFFHSRICSFNKTMLECANLKTFLREGIEYKATKFTYGDFATFARGRNEKVYCFEDLNEELRNSWFKNNQNLTRYIRDTRTILQMYRDPAIKLTFWCLENYVDLINSVKDELNLLRNYIFDNVKNCILTHFILDCVLKVFEQIYIVRSALELEVVMINLLCKSPEPRPRRLSREEM